MVAVIRIPVSGRKTLVFGKKLSGLTTSRHQHKIINQALIQNQVIPNFKLGSATQLRTLGHQMVFKPYCACESPGECVKMLCPGPTLRESDLECLGWHQ